MNETVDVAGVEIPREMYEQSVHEKRLRVPVRPDGLRIALNRELRRRLSRESKGTVLDDKVVFQPVRVSKPVSHAEALDKVAEGLYHEFQKNIAPSTVATLSAFLDRYEALLMEQAYRAGRPIPRELIRNALAGIYAKGEAKRSGK